MYRVRVLESAAEIGHVDVRVGHGADGDSVREITADQTVPIKFRVLTRSTEAADTTPHLVVIRGDGILGEPADIDSTFRSGVKVKYGFTPASGFENLRVTLDGADAPAQGRIIMDGPHVLAVSADRRVALASDDQPLLDARRAVLTAADPVVAFQRYLDAGAALAARVGEAEAARRLAIVEFLAYDVDRDADALIRVDSALAGHVFTAGGGDPSTSASRRLATASEEPAAPPLVVYFVNGIFNKASDARTATTALDLIVQEARIARPVSVRFVYNRTMAAELTPARKREVMCVQDFDRARPFLGDLSFDLRFTRCLGNMYYGSHMDLTEAARQVLQLSGVASYATEVDARLLADSILHQTSLKRDVIVVPHSQGNLMTQQALDVVRAHPGGADEQCVGVVSLAAPMSSRWPITEGADLMPVVVDGDAITWLGMNQFERTPTTLSRQGDAAVARWERAARWNAAARVIAEFEKVKWGVRLHGVTESYMGVPESRAAIRSGLRGLAARRCGVRTYWVVGMTDEASGYQGAGSFWVRISPNGDGWKAQVRSFWSYDEDMYNGPAVRTPDGFHLAFEYHSSVLYAGMLNENQNAVVVDLTQDGCSGRLDNTFHLTGGEGGPTTTYSHYSLTC
jgi:hypothetical protein